MSGQGARRCGGWKLCRSLLLSAAQHLFTSLNLSPSQSLFSSPFVLADNDAQGAEQSVSHGKKIWIRGAGSNVQCWALSELAQFTPWLLSLHRIGTQNTLQRNPSSPFPSSSSLFFSPFLCFISILDSTVPWGWLPSLHFSDILLQSHTFEHTPPPTTTTTPIFLVPSSAITLSSRLQPSLKHTKPHPTLAFCGLLGRDLNGDTHLHSTP